MRNGNERLSQDVAALSTMAEQMAQYLDSDILFWPLSRTNMPMLTLGGYLMREHRLRALSELLTSEQRAQVETATGQFNQALAERIVRFETKAHQELEARLRQWEESLKDMSRDSFDRSGNYDTVVETRAMIQALIDRLSLPPYRMEARPGQHLEALDTRLRSTWRAGDFVWPTEWSAAYPRAEYWWLYGSPLAGQDRS